MDAPTREMNYCERCRKAAEGRRDPRTGEWRCSECAPDDEADTPTDLAAIAKRQLGVQTLETRNRDALDFYDLGVWQIKAALEAAYQAGRDDATRKTRS